MPQKLFRVRITRTLYVVADDALDAELKVKGCEPNTAEESIDVRPATRRSLEKDGWLHTDAYFGPEKTPCRLLLKPTK